MGFEILEGVTSADIAFLARGASIEELFGEAARALISVMIENPDTIEGTHARPITATGAGMDLLLAGFLDEILFYKDAESLVLVPGTLQIRESDDGFSLVCEARGEKIVRGRHGVLVDVKAVTLHRLSVEKAGDEWRATVVLDV
ncbi:MAG: archease [Spirochaetes bacterium]|nr:MAG: archease [Spirochaetota bacterium]